MSLGSLGDYALTQELGQGGMGKVFLASEPGGSRVALKTILFPEGLSARARWETVERFQREARAARSLDHPNICQVLDIGAEDETFFIVMEYLEGRSLREEVDASGALGIARSVQLVLDVCAALAYAHDRGIIHRDIKPDNVMVLNSGQAKLMDFGLASIVHETGVTQTGTMMGTLAYMSPEQARGQKLDARSDIFSVGATFYEMLSGQQAFGGDAPGAILEEILNKEVEPIRGLPPEVTRVLSKCLRKRAPYRFQTVQEMITAVLATGFAPAAASTPNATAVQGTMVLPKQQPSAPSTAQSRPLASQRAAPPHPSAAPAKPAVGQQGRAKQERKSGFRCSKCREWLADNTPSCWKCGTPNPAVSRRKAYTESKTEISKALEGFKPSRKRSWLPWRR